MGEAEPLCPAEGPPPRELFAELRDWQRAGVADPVFRASDPSTGTVYVRADDGSAETLERLESEPGVPAPRLLEVRSGWLLLEALPGAPMNDDSWLARPREAAPIVADALLRLAASDLTHGDMCLPNILGDPSTGRLSGLVDWGDAGRFDRSIDVASAVWSCGYNGYPAETALAVLALIGWPRTDAAEVERLERLWSDLAGPPG